MKGSTQKQIISIPRGQTFRKSSSDATMPTQHKAVNICAPLEIQSTVGANHSPRMWPSGLRYSLQVFVCGKDSARADETANLKDQ